MEDNFEDFRIFLDSNLMDKRVRDVFLGMDSNRQQNIFRFEGFSIFLRTSIFISHQGSSCMIKIKFLIKNSIGKEFY
jgi:hypothetical protein